MPEVTLITTSQVADKYQDHRIGRPQVGSNREAEARSVTTPGGTTASGESDVADLLAAEPVAEASA